jgi:hypothetical protein
MSGDVHAVTSCVEWEGHGLAFFYKLWCREVDRRTFPRSIGPPCRDIVYIHGLRMCASTSSSFVDGLHRVLVEENLANFTQLDALKVVGRLAL